MTIDHTRNLRALIAANQRVAEGATLESVASLESAGGGDFTGNQADAVLDRIVENAQTLPRRARPDQREFAEALNTLRAHAPTALKKLVGDPQAPIGGLSPDELASLEAIIIADGSRPSFLLDGGVAPLQHPFMGSWKDKVATNQQALAGIAGAVGRIQPKYGGDGRFIGTGCLVDKDKGIVLTNFHVLDDAPRFGVKWEDAGNGQVKFLDWLEIDFVGEAFTFEESRFNIVGARRGERSGRGLGHLDAVTMRIESIDAKSRMPEAPVRFSNSIADYKKASGSDFCTIGFPSTPAIENTTGVDWNFVLRTLFDNQFGVKRLAPGRIILQPQANTLDSLGISFGHDATTFGGASGSPLIAWGALDQSAIGLHFAGQTSVSNYAVAVAMVAEELAALGVPL
jgi:serine protease